jgi:Phage Mu protein F like protein
MPGRHAYLDADRLAQRAKTASAVFFDRMRRDILGQLTNMRRDGASLEELIDGARERLLEHVDSLTILLADTDLAAWLSGAAGVAQVLPRPEALIGAAATAPLQPPEWQGMRVWQPLVEHPLEDLRSRQLVTRSEFEQLGQLAKSRAFTVAYQNTQKGLAKIREALVQAVDEGFGLAEFKRRLDASLGKGKLSAGALENVFRTNIARATSRGFDHILDHPQVSGEFPYEGNLEIADSRLTEFCKKISKSGLQGTHIYRRDDPFYRKWKAPRHWQCRCTRMAMSIADAAAAGVKEAQLWLRTGRPPVTPSWVTPPNIENLQGYPGPTWEAA